MDRTCDGRRSAVRGAKEQRLATFTEDLVDAGGKLTTVRVAVERNRRRRSRVAFHFQPNGGVLMEVPPNVDATEARRLLRGHARWVLKRRRVACRTMISYPENYVDGTILFYQGRQLSLRLIDGTDVELRDGELAAPAAAPRERVWTWYAHRADVDLAAAVGCAASRLTWLDVAPPWRHRYMTSRWGSFSSAGRMSLNTHLVKLPEDLVEYVVVHELCHAKHLNHGRGFQRLMDASLADWRRRRTKLHEYGSLLAERPPPRRWTS